MGLGLLAIPVHPEPYRSNRGDRQGEGKRSNRCGYGEEECRVVNGFHVSLLMMMNAPGSVSSA